MALTQENRVAAIETPLGTDKVLLAAFAGTEQLGRLFEFEVELLSEDHAIPFDDIIGQNVTVRLETTRDLTRYFNGYVSRFVQRPTGGDLASYRATIVPWLWFLTRTADCRIFQNKTAPDIIEEVFKGHGLDAFERKLYGSYTPWEYCVQYRETDFNFVSRLMEQEGIYYFFKHENGKHTLVLADSPDSHAAHEGYAELTFRPPTAGTSDLEHIRDWTINKELLPGTFLHSDFDFENPKTSLLTEPVTVTRKHAQAEFAMFDYPGEYTKPDEGTDWAKVRIQEIQARHEILQGQADARGIAPGHTLDVKELPREDQNRKYLILTASHSFQTDGYGSGGGGDADFYSCSFSVMPAAEPFRPARITPKPLIQGPQTAMVVGPSGEEIHTDKYGRVKLKFHWDRDSKGDENSSCWVRVAQSWAGKKWGALYTPRIGQEVIVEFLEGDPDLPIITGRVYNGESLPPYDPKARPTLSTLKSNSSKGGGGFNEIRFEDKKGEEQIFVHAEKDFELRVKNDHFETTMNDHHLIVENDQFVEIKANRNETVAKDHCEEITGDRNLTVKGKQNTAITGDVWLKVDGKVEDTIGGDHTEKTTGNYKLKAAQITLEADSKIEIIVGGSKITMDPGKIEIKSPQITIKGDAKVEVSGAMTKLEGSGMLTVKGGMVMIN